LGVHAEARAAAILQIDNTDPNRPVLLGARNVYIDGAYYDVAFEEGTCVALYDGCDDAADAPFPDTPTTEAAAQALLDQVFVDGPLGQFDSDPDLTYGCESTDLCHILIPVLLPPLYFYGVTALNFDAAFGRPDLILDTVSASGDALFVDSAVSNDRVHATFRPSQPLPEPDTSALFSLAIALMGWARYRRTRRP
jgi:hypothetical protein